MYAAAIKGTLAKYSRRGPKLILELVVCDCGFSSFDIHTTLQRFETEYEYTLKCKTSIIIILMSLQDNFVCAYFWKFDMFKRKIQTTEL